MEPSYSFREALELLKDQFDDAGVKFAFRGKYWGWDTNVRGMRDFDTLSQAVAHFMNVHTEPSE